MNFLSKSKACVPMFVLGLAACSPQAPLQADDAKVDVETHSAKQARSDRTEPGEGVFNRYYGIEESVGNMSQEVSAALTDKEWQVLRLNERSLPSIDRPTIVFSRDGTITGRAGCNAYTGRFTMKNGNFAVSRLSLSRKACSPALMDLEDAFVRTLGSVMSLVINTDGTITLVGDDAALMIAK